MMWKKNEPQSRSPQPAPQPPVVQPPEPVVRKETAVIGPTITVKGEIFGKEDLEIQGTLEGTIKMKKHRVTVGDKGRIKADVHAKSIHVAGEVEGNLFGDDEVVLRESGKLFGNITAARVTLEDGSKFKGSIDMEPAAKEESKKASKSTPASEPGNGTPPRDSAKETPTPMVAKPLRH
jgi:cytoskeletal protein CcmA (bactofilin family)